MDVHHLRVFLSVFRNRSFSKASRDLHITQPTVSEHIRGLEEELGIRLFDRTGRRIIPTREAGLLYPAASEIVEKLEGIKDAVRELKGEVKGELMIGASTIPGTYLLPPMAAVFRARHPGTSFHLVEADSREIARMVAGHDLLLGVIGTKADVRDLEFTPLDEDELVLVAPPGLVGKKAITPRELAGVPLLLREEGSGTRRTAEARLLEKGVATGDLNVVAVLGSTASVKEAARAGLGATILSRLAVRDELQSGALVEVALKGVSMKRSFYAVKHRKRTLPAHYRAFLDFLKGKR